MNTAKKLGLGSIKEQEDYILKACRPFENVEFEDGYLTNPKTFFQGKNFEKMAFACRLITEETNNGRNPWSKDTLQTFGDAAAVIMRQAKWLPENNVPYNRRVSLILSGKAEKGFKRFADRQDMTDMMEYGIPSDYDMPVQLLDMVAEQVFHIDNQKMLHDAMRKMNAAVKQGPDIPDTDKKWKKLCDAVQVMNTPTTDIEYVNSIPGLDMMTDISKKYYKTRKALQDYLDKNGLPSDYNELLLRAEQAEQHVHVKGENEMLNSYYFFVTPDPDYSEYDYGRAVAERLSQVVDYAKEVSGKSEDTKVSAVCTPAGADNRFVIAYSGAGEDMAQGFKKSVMDCIPANSGITFSKLNAMTPEQFKGLSETYYSHLDGFESGAYEAKEMPGSFWSELADIMKEITSGGFTKPTPEEAQTADRLFSENPPAPEFGNDGHALDGSGEYDPQLDDEGYYGKDRDSGMEM